MTTERLNELRGLREIVMGEFNTDYGGGNVGLTPAGEKMVEIINKAIPVKPTDIHATTIAVQNNHGIVGHCGCGGWVLQNWQFCPMCGQAIDWQEATK